VEESIGAGIWVNNEENMESVDSKEEQLNLEKEKVAIQMKEAEKEK